MFMLRSTCLCVICHVFAQIYMLVLRPMSLCLDICVYVLHAMLMSLDLCWLLCHVLLQPFLSLDISLSCFLALSVGCRSRSHGLGLHPYTQAYIKGFGSFPLHVYVCFIASMLYLQVSLSRSRLYHAWCPQWACVCVVAFIPPRVCLDVTTCEIHLCGVGVLDSHLSLHVSLSKSRLCHAWCPPWACACVVAFVLPRVCLDVTTCEIHLRGVGVLDSHLSPPRAMLICLPCLLRATCLAFFASMLSLHAYLHIHA